MIEIDGSYGEGGGQILRTALSLSAITGQAFHLTRIRAKREKPGLRPQHLLATQALATITGATVEGASVGSTSLRFLPGSVMPGTYRFDVGTAGSVTLVLQALLPALALARERSRIVVTGGTHVPGSPPFDYLDEVFVPLIARCGVQCSVTLLRAGWIPAGGGEIAMTVEPTARVQPVSIQRRGALRRLTVRALSSNLPEHIGRRECDQAANLLADIAKGTQTFETRLVPAIGRGNMVFVLAEFESSIAGFSVTGEIGKRAERVAEEAVADLRTFLGGEAAVDLHLSDQLLVYMALANGRSSIVTARCTEHARTNMWVIQQFVPAMFLCTEATPAGLATIEVEPRANR